MAVIGCGGSGKTTLARELAARLELPVVHADFVVYRDGDTPRPEIVWQAELAALAEGDAWVIDAMKLSTLERHVERADAVVFLDLPRWSCYAGVVRRRLRSRSSRGTLPRPSSSSSAVAATSDGISRRSACRGALRSRPYAGHVP